MDTFRSTLSRRPSVSRRAMHCKCDVKFHVLRRCLWVCRNATGPFAPPAPKKVLFGTSNLGVGELPDAVAWCDATTFFCYPRRTRKLANPEGSFNLPPRPNIMIFPSRWNGRGRSRSRLCKGIQFTNATFARAILFQGHSFQTTTPKNKSFPSRPLVGTAAI